MRTKISMTNISLFSSLERVGLPLIVTSSKPHLCFLVDTGATHNVLFSYVYKELGNYFTPNDSRANIIGLNGESKGSLSVCGSISFGDKEISASFSVVDSNEAVATIQKESGIQLHGILGIPFLIENKWVLDFNKLTLQC